MECLEMELLKRDVLRGSDGQDCFVLTLDDETESQDAEEHILRWLAVRGLGHSRLASRKLGVCLATPVD
jgi:hypothetical protein